MLAIAESNQTSTPPPPQHKEKNKKNKNKQTRKTNNKQTKFQSDLNLSCPQDPAPPQLKVFQHSLFCLL